MIAVPAAEPAIAAHLIRVDAPMVGTFYRAPGPDTSPFVQEGDTVKEGQVLCIIEAMKLMNEIESKASGRIVKILVENAQPVEFGQEPLPRRAEDVVARVFHKILIANRGEIALRVLRTCREMGIRTVVAHSTADADSLPVRLADESICIGPAESRASYLNIPSIISAASITDSEAIHPGYGLLSENAAFAEICRACGITFIGPSPEAIRLMGDKAQAREMAKAGGRAGGAGQRGVRSTAWTRRRTWRDRVGYPGNAQGGRGRRRARHADRARAGRCSPRLRHLPGGGPEGLLLLRALPGEVRGRGAARRGAGGG